MGTKFSTIYCENAIMKIDPTLAKLPIYQYYSLSWKQLKVGKTRFIYECLKDLDSYIPYSDSEYEFVGDGVETEFEIIPLPQTLETEIYAGIMNVNEEFYTENIDYTYDNINHIIKFATAPQNGSKILIAFYNIGEFNDELNDIEIRILAESMNVSFLQAQLVNVRSLNQIIYTKTYSIHSQAEQLKQLNATLSSWLLELDDSITTYSYREPRDGMVKLSNTKGVKRWH